MIRQLASSVVLPLTVMLVSYALSSQACAVTGFPPSLNVFPDEPNDEDAIILTAFEIWGDTCTPTGLAAAVMGETIQLEVQHFYPPGTFCLTVLTDYELQATVGPLGAGTYDVFATLNSTSFPPEGPDYLGSFTVVPEPASFALGIFGLLFVLRYRARCTVFREAHHSAARSPLRELSPHFVYCRYLRGPGRKI